MKRILTLALTLALAGCGAPAEKAEPEKAAADTQADKAAVDKLRDDFTAAFNAGDADKIGELYAENAIATGGDRATLQGRTAIVESNKQMFSQVTAKIAITPVVTKTSGDLAYDQGTYTLEMTPKAGGKPSKEDGRYVVVLQREGAAWKVVADIDNKNPPPPAPAAAGKK